MSDLLYYIDFPQNAKYNKGTIGDRVIDFHQEIDVENIDVCLLIYSSQKFLHVANRIKDCLFELYDHSGLNICDLGVAKQGNTKDDSDASVSFILSFLKELNKRVVLIGDKNLPNSELQYSSEISHITNRIHHKQNNYNINYIGSQIYLNSQEILNNSYDDLSINIYRLGELKKDIAKVEPCLRDSDLSIIQLDVVEGSHVYSEFGSPVGFSIHDLCQLSFYIGQSSKNSVVCFNSVGVQSDKFCCEKQFALCIWHYLFGMKHTVKPELNSSKLKSYHLTEIHEGVNFTFFEDVGKDFWWLKIESDSFEKVIASSAVEHKLLLSGEISPRILRALS